MAERMNLGYGGETIEFSPRPGYLMPDDSNRVLNTALDKTLYIYNWGTKGRWEIELNNISTGDADNIKDWWENNNTLTFTPDLTGAPSTTRNVFIVNDQAPMSMMFIGAWDSKYEGTLILQEA